MGAHFLSPPNPVTRLQHLHQLTGWSWLQPVKWSPSGSTLPAQNQLRGEKNIPLASGKESIKLLRFTGNPSEAFRHFSAQGKLALLVASCRLY